MSPTMLSREHDISPRLYQKVTLQVKAACGGWDDIDRLLLTKVMPLIYNLHHKFPPSALFYIELISGNAWKYKTANVFIHRRYFKNIA